MTTARRLAIYLAVNDPDDYPAGQCVAWMDSADRLCGKPTDVYLCPRHRKVAERRQAAALAKVKRQRDSTRALLLRELPALIAKRDRLTAQRDKVADVRRHDTDDLSAYGGIGIRQTPRQRAKYAARVDNALAEYTRLDRIITDLDHRIAVAESFKEGTTA